MNTDKSKDKGILQDNIDGDYSTSVHDLVHRPKNKSKCEECKFDPLYDIECKDCIKDKTEKKPKSIKIDTKLNTKKAEKKINNITNIIQNSKKECLNESLKHLYIENLFYTLQQTQSLDIRNWCQQELERTRVELWQEKLKTNLQKLEEPYSI